jgi:hypothetical protein
MSRRALVLLAVFGLCVALSIALVLADDEEKSEPKYLGMKGCKTCHKMKKVGNQYNKWKNGPHAKTYTQLAGEESKKIAKEAGVTGDPQEADECLKCHITAFGVEEGRLSKNYKKEEGVTCEACHGPGSDYKGSHKKKGKQEDAKKAGFVAKPDEESCKKCHNKESPTYKEFKYDEKVKEIAHSMPGKKEEKKEEEKKEEK